ncbi:BAR domain-containing protein [Mycoemilia scoparia]|uniref:BAR domain-containing protein n=1 Tax=Mycoemilia scoparia TaxID=417184 RepID=A0A9W8A0V1_9FUNG|nr:BAR domain-containing protein [Mycoemilia scoparia]
MDFFNKISSEVRTKFPEYTDKASKTFTLYKQAKRFGANAHITELPQDYLVLEQRFLALQKTHRQLVRLTKGFVSSANGLNMEQIQTQAISYTKQAGQQINRFIGTNAGSDPNSQNANAAQEDNKPKTYYHAVSRECLESSEKVDLEQPLGAGMFKFGCLEEKVGNAELVQDLRKQVYDARIMLDAAKTSHKNAKPERQAALAQDVEKAEDHYVTIVEKTMTQMRELLESPELLRSLSSLVAAQIQFHQKALEHLQDLAPELDEIQATQEALYKN